MLSDLLSHVSLVRDDVAGYKPMDSGYGVLPVQPDDHTGGDDDDGDDGDDDGFD